MMKQPQRRKVLGWLGVAGLCLTCVGANRGRAAEAGAPHWGYDGAHGPQHWGRLDPAFHACARGAEQAPIDLGGAMRIERGTVDVAYREMPLRIVNNGHTVQVNCAPGSRTVIDGEAYDLLQFHFHHPSEHMLSGKAYDLECHFVHRSVAGKLAVLGVFLRLGRENAALEPIWQAMPEMPGPERAAGTPIHPAALLPVERGYFRYMGSLTTPPCTAGIVWTVFRQPIDVSLGQIRRFADLFPLNARPVQPLRRRMLNEAL